MEGSQPLCLDPVLYAAAIIISREDPSRDSAIRDAPRLPRARHQAATGARPAAYMILMMILVIMMI